MESPYGVTRIEGLTESGDGKQPALPIQAEVARASRHNRPETCVIAQRHTMAWNEAGGEARKPAIMKVRAWVLAPFAGTG